MCRVLSSSAYNNHHNHLLLPQQGDIRKGARAPKWMSHQSKGMRRSHYQLQNELQLVICATIVNEVILRLKATEEEEQVHLIIDRDGQQSQEFPSVGQHNNSLWPPEAGSWM